MSTRAPSLHIKLAQLNPIVGNVADNCEKLIALHQTSCAKTDPCDLIITSELYLSGYPAEDLYQHPLLLTEIEQALEKLCTATAAGGPGILVGTPASCLSEPENTEDQERRGFARLGNMAFLIADGHIQARIQKYQLPNYGIFDDQRLFHPAERSDIAPVCFRGWSLGIMICEDMWFDSPSDILAAQGADCLIALNASPFDPAKQSVRRMRALERVQKHHIPLIYVNQIGGQDDIIFDGASFALQKDGMLHTQLPAWTEKSDICLSLEKDPAPSLSSAPLDLYASESHEQALYQAACLGLRDYVVKNGFPSVLIGLSGGLDSALCAAIAVDALGADKVRCVMMPSQYTSTESLEDARQVTALLGLSYESIAIDPAVDAFSDMLSPALPENTPGITYENLQSRSRGMILMALSNATGAMVVTTGNKSEMAVGYATLYGDMCGGYNPIKDMYKTTAFAVARWRNQAHPAFALGPKGAVMPDRVIAKPPSAELRPDQKDEDSLPPYDLLDKLLIGLIEDQLTPADLLAQGFSQADIQKCWTLLDIAEYKRRQSAPGPKLTSRQFGKDRRMPITNHLRRFLKI